MCPLSTRVKVARKRAGGLGSALASTSHTVRVTSVVPCGYCEPESSRNTSDRFRWRLVPLRCGA